MSYKNKQIVLHRPELHHTAQLGEKNGDLNNSRCESTTTDVVGRKETKQGREEWDGAGRTDQTPLCWMTLGVGSRSHSEENSTHPSDRENRRSCSRQSNCAQGLAGMDGVNSKPWLVICHAVPTQKQRNAVGSVITCQPAAAAAANHSQTKNRNFGQNPDFNPMTVFLFLNQCSYRYRPVYQI